MLKIKITKFNQFRINWHKLWKIRESMLIVLATILWPMLENMIFKEILSVLTPLTLINKAKNILNKSPSFRGLLTQSGLIKREKSTRNNNSIKNQSDKSCNSSRFYRRCSRSTTVNFKISPKRQQNKSQKRFLKQ